MKILLIFAGCVIFLLLPAATIYWTTCYTNWFLDGIWVTYRPLILALKPHVGGFGNAVWLGSILQGIVILTVVFVLLKQVVSKLHNKPLKQDK